MLTLLISLFLFVDRLIQGRMKDALRELLYVVPKEASLITSLSISHLSTGWDRGIVTMATSLPERVRFMATREWKMHPDYMLSTQPAMDAVLNHFEGPLFGRMTRRLIMTQLSTEILRLFESYEDSPHNPGNAEDLRGTLAKLKQQYADPYRLRAEYILSEIKEFLQQRIDSAMPGNEKDWARKALRCVERFQEENGDRFASAVDISGNPKPLETLCLVWLALTAEAPQRALEGLRNTLASYLTHIQRGMVHITDPDSPPPATDSPECGTGAVSILLLPLQAIPNSRYILKESALDTTGKIQRLLDARIGMSWAFRRNAGSLGAATHLTLRTELQRPLSAYAAMLTMTSTGHKILGGSMPGVTEDIADDLAATALETFAPGKYI